MRLSWLVLSACWAVGSLLALGGCAAVYPEVHTPIREVPDGKDLEPPPPDELLYIFVKSAHIPTRTRGGRQWDEVGGDLPDPFLKVYLNDELLYVTPIQSNTLEPTWPNQPKRNYHIPFESVIRLELWDQNPINNQPICIHKLEEIHEEKSTGEVDVLCDGGASMTLVVRAARPELGLGFSYELRGGVVAVTKVLELSPAERGGLLRWDEIVRVADEDVLGMESTRLKSLINANAPTGVRMVVRRKDKSTKEMVLKQGPIYTTYVPVGEAAHLRDVGE